MFIEDCDQADCAVLSNATILTTVRCSPVEGDKYFPEWSVQYQLNATFYTGVASFGYSECSSASSSRSTATSLGARYVSGSTYTCYLYRSAVFFDKPASRVSLGLGLGLGLGLPVLICLSFVCCLLLTPVVLAGCAFCLVLTVVSLVVLCVSLLSALGIGGSAVAALGVSGAASAVVVNEGSHPQGQSVVELEEISPDYEI